MAVLYKESGKVVGTYRNGGETLAAEIESGVAKMNPVTHFLTGWALANCVPSLERKERAMVALACVVPDVDGLGAVVDLATRNSAHPTEWFSRYHHQLHSLAFAIVVAGVCFVLARQRWVTALLALLSFHLHLVEDLIGSRGPDGYQWPIPYLAPFRSVGGIAWSGQWGLNAWPNFAITIGFLALMFFLAWKRGFSPLEIVSTSTDQKFVATLRARFGPA
ncbi:MAG TPA: metal-dependent hydrolase [Candidatus Dormibacteraeota bacterium]|jgi:inner membrane protein|nr:metal-dependent hydrolase [Candidatus Dormibacteraeota bacterium]